MSGSQARGGSDAPDVRFCEMSDAEFDAYLERTTAEYAEEGARATGMAPDAAMEKARTQLRELLPDGRKTEGHLIRKIVSAGDECFGRLWTAIRRDETPPNLFIYDIAVDETARGKGVGSAAMLLLEHEAARLGLSAIRLHVFSHNTDAIRLYERLGYEVTFEGRGGRQMTRYL